MRYIDDRDESAAGRTVKVNLAKIQPTMASLEWMSAVDPEIKEGCVIEKG